MGNGCGTFLRVRAKPELLSWVELVSVDLVNNFGCLQNEKHYLRKTGWQSRQNPCWATLCDNVVVVCVAGVVIITVICWAGVDGWAVSVGVDCDPSLLCRQHQYAAAAGRRWFRPAWGSPAVTANQAHTTSQTIHKNNPQLYLTVRRVTNRK